PMHGRHAPRHQARAVGHAYGAGDIEPVKDRAARCDAIDVGRAQHWVTIAAEKVGTVLIGDEQDEVRAIFHESPMAGPGSLVNRTFCSKTARLNPMSGAAQIAHSPLAKVREQIVRACAESRRGPASVTLVAISKTFGAEAIDPVIRAGHRMFGENR